MKSSLPRLGVLSVFAVAVVAGPAWGQEAIRQSVVKILSTRRSPDLYRPWTKGSPQELSGSGAIIEGKRVLTNAHVVSYASQIYVQPFQSADKVSAKVVAVAPGIDLAVLSIEDDAFFKDRPALPFAAELPQIKDKVNAYGFPVGGTELSVTEGIISRIEFGPYYAETMGLRIQVDAPLNPGNSGGPAISNGKIVGLVFSKMREAENVGYLIPVEEINRFLKDTEDGKYDGKPQIFEMFQSVENEALRAKLGLKSGQGGAMVTEPYKVGESEPLKEWDVVTRIGDKAIGSDSKVPARDDLRLYFEYFIPQMLEDGKVPLTVLRDGKELKIDLPAHLERNSVIKYLKGEYPRYFIYGPLVFSPATQEFIAGLTDKAMPMFSYRNSPLMSRRFGPVEFAGEELVVVASRMLPHAITKSYDDPFTAVVSEVNGVKIKNLRHLAQTLRDVKDPFTVFKFADRNTERTVFRTDEMRKATEEILTDNGIRYQNSDDLRDVVK